MLRNPKWLVGLSLVAVTASAAWFLNRSESERVRDELSSIARALEFDAQSSVLPARLKQQVATHLNDPVTIEIVPSGELHLSSDELIQAYLTYSEEMRALHITLSNVGIVLDAGHQRATAKGDAQLERVLLSGERLGEPRKFVVSLVKFAQRWRVAQFRISEPRVDQPEARP